MSNEVIQIVVGASIAVLLFCAAGILVSYRPSKRDRLEKRIARNEHKGFVSCSFCGKSQKQVKKLIKGPETLYICDECVDLCNDILVEDGILIEGVDPAKTTPVPVGAGMFGQPDAPPEWPKPLQGIWMDPSGR